MRVYEYAKKVGTTSAAVMKMAEENDVEIYSPLSVLESSDIEALDKGFLQQGREVTKAAYDAVAAKRAEKSQKAAGINAEKDKLQAQQLEEARQRALAAHKGGKVNLSAKSSAAKKQPPKKEKPTKVEIKVTPPAPPKISIQVSTPEVPPAPAAPSAPKISITVGKKPEEKKPQNNDPKKNQKKPAKPFRMKDDDESNEYLHGKDRKAPTGGNQRNQQQSNRVGGNRAGFASVSMKTTPPPQEAPSVSVSVSSREISIRGAIIVKELAMKLGVRPNRLIADLMGLKVLASINQRVEPDVATKVAQKYGFKVNIEHARDRANAKPVLKQIDADDEIPKDLPEQMKPRPPVVTFLGHVDHGKTTLMDYIRHTKVASGEAGGITQQISAYQVEINDRKITFLDTPGHAAFSAMRQRGAQLTDIAVIIIAADDGIMPQTEEAIRCARQAGVQIMVAITKCDKPTANPERVKQMLQKEGLTPEEWGGDIVCCEVSGKSGKGVDSLLEMMLLQADVLELTANPDRRANGYVVEAELEQGFGPSATILVTGGTLKVGDPILIGEHFGKVRSLIDDHGRRVKEAPPSMPVKCTGLSGVPDAGAEFRVMLDEKRARTLATEAARVRKEAELSMTKATSLDALMSQMGANDKLELSVIVKSDTQGSLEAIVESLRAIKSEKVSLHIIGTGTGNVSLTDVKTAAAGKAMIVGFDIGCDSGVQQQARHDGVHINSFRIIYELMDFVKKSMMDLLPPEYKEVIKGHAEIKAVYDISKLGKIAGSQMLDGMLISTARYRVMRGGKQIWEGKLQSLRHFKDEVKEVTGQQECGICFANYEAFQQGDTVECYILEELPRSL